MEPIRREIATRYLDHSATATLTAANAWTDPIQLLGDFALSISGAWVGTITLQWSFDGGATWHDIERYTANISDTGNGAAVGVLYRIGFHPGEYTSGAAVVRLAQ